MCRPHHICKPGLLPFLLSTSLRLFTEAPLTHHGNYYSLSAFPASLRDSGVQAWIHFPGSLTYVAVFITLVGPPSMFVEGVSGEMGMSILAQTTGE